MNKVKTIDYEQYNLALLNILEDAEEEKKRYQNIQEAVLNILEDSKYEKEKLLKTQRATMNILEDYSAKEQILDSSQKALLNILEDFDSEKKKVEKSNVDLTNEIDMRKIAENRLIQANTETEAAYNELETFSYSVAHDLRAPLRSIDGFSQAILEDCVGQFDEMGKEYFNYIRNSAQQMAQLIDDLLKLSNISNHEITKQPLDLSHIFRNAAQKTQHDNPEPTVKLIAPPELKAFGDYQLVNIMMDNLVGNAFKFSAKSEFPCIEIGSQTLNGKETYFLRDNGCGFDMEYADKLFGVFQRLHSNTEYEGTGIGLATVHRIMKRHGGKIWAEGKVGEGATFYFILEDTYGHKTDSIS